MRERRDFPGAACLRSTEGEHVYPGTTNINGLTLFLDQVPRLYFGAKPDHPQPPVSLRKLMEIVIEEPLAAKHATPGTPENWYRGTLEPRNSELYAGRELQGTSTAVLSVIEFSAPLNGKRV